MSPTNVQSSRKNPYPLDSLGRQIAWHWKLHWPKLSEALQEAGQFEAAVHAAQERTHDALHELVQQGWDWNQAWEAIRREWAFLPAEEDEDEENQPQPDPVILIERFERRRREAERTGAPLAP